MPSSSSLVTGLDIGTSSIKVVIGSKNAEGSVDIVGIGTAPSRGLRKGVVVNIESTVASISKAVSQAESMAGCEISSVIASISGGHIRSQNSHGIVAVKNREVSGLDIEKVIEAARAVALPMDREILHVLPQEFIVDDQDGVRDPLGISGVRLEVNVHLLTGAVASAQNVVKCANRCGLSVSDIIATPLAAGSAAVSEEEQELGVLVVDIGGGTTSLSIFHAGGVHLTDVLPVGGNHITNDIAAGLRTPVSSAERIKCDYGAVSIADSGVSDIIEVPSVGGRQARVLSKSVLADIIEPRISELIGLVQRQVVKAGCENLLISGVVLTGGTSNLPGISQVAEQVFNLPVRIAGDFSVGGLEDLVRSPEYATAVGLVVQGGRASHIRQRRLETSQFGALGSTVRRFAGWFAEHF